MRRVAFIGVGNMGEAMVRGMLRAGVVPPEALAVCDTRVEVAERLARELGVVAAALPDAVAGLAARADGAADADADVVVLAVKPQGMADALRAIADAGVAPGTVVLSVAAGVAIATIEAALPGTEVVRTMPNTPALVGLGASAYALGTLRTGRGEAVAQAVLGAVGLALPVDEADLDAVTALSGSGPAYVFKMLEALDAAGRAAGLAPDTASVLARRTLLGAATLADLTTPEGIVPPAELRRRVTSPGGTTAAALAVLDARHWGDALVDAVLAAKARGQELGRIATSAAPTAPTALGALARIAAVTARGGHPVVVLDVDLTLVENGPRTRAVLADWLRSVGRVAPVELEDARTMPLVFSIKDNLEVLIARAGLGIELLGQGLAHWRKAFFDPAFLVHDEALPGAVEAVSRMAAAGATIVYLTARPGPLAAATTDRLLALGFPCAAAGAMLILKTDPAERDDAFKDRALEWCKRLGTVVLCAENEPAHANAMRRVFPDALTVLVATRHSTPAPALADGIVRVAGLADVL